MSGLDSVFWGDLRSALQMKDGKDLQDLFVKMWDALNDDCDIEGAIEYTKSCILRNEVVNSYGISLLNSVMRNDDTPDGFVRFVMSMGGAVNDSARASWKDAYSFVNSNRQPRYTVNLGRLQRLKYLIAYFKGVDAKRDVLVRPVLRSEWVRSTLEYSSGDLRDTCCLASNVYKQGTVIFEIDVDYLTTWLTEGVRGFLRAISLYEGEKIIHAHANLRPDEIVTFGAAIFKSYAEASGVRDTKFSLCFEVNFMPSTEEDWLSFVREVQAGYDRLAPDELPQPLSPLTGLWPYKWQVHDKYRGADSSTILITYR